MDANVNDTDLLILFSCYREIEQTSLRDTGANMRRRLLLEFLEKKSGREENTSHSVEINVRKQVTLPDDLLFRILVLVPAESLFRLQFVCKKWFSLINSSVFIRCHTQQSETVLICQKLTPLEPGCYPLQPEAKLKSYFHFMHLSNGEDNFIESSVVELVEIQASCDGLVLVTAVRNFILMNPVTRKHIALPLGVGGDTWDSSYGIAFCNEAKTYKVVHLFRESIVETGCEILTISARKWTRIEAAAPELILTHIRRISPVSISGSLYWMPRNRNCDYYVSMNLQEEKFISKKLPTSRHGIRDRLIEIGGSLGFVTQDEQVINSILQVWILMNDDGSGENWMKRYNINLNVDIRHIVPICSSRNGKGIVFENLMRQLYVYNSDTGDWKLILSRDDDEARGERMEKLYISHRSTLASWEYNQQVDHPY